MVLIIIDVSCPWLWTALEHRLPEPLRCIRDVPVLVRFPYWWCLHHYNCLLFIIIPPVTDVHVMLKNIECERRVWSTKRSQGKTERHLYISINKKWKPPLIVSSTKWWKNFISRDLQSNKYGAQLSPVATGALVGLVPQTKLQFP